MLIWSYYFCLELNIIFWKFYNYNKYAMMIYKYVHIPRYTYTNILFYIYCENSKWNGYQLNQQSMKNK
jgi:hypothetical protein